MQNTSYAELDDDALITRSKTGDVEAFREIGVRCFPLINALTCDLTGNLTWGRDLARETLIVAWNQLPTLRERVELRLWLCDIALKLVADFRRRMDA